MNYACQRETFIQERKSLIKSLTFFYYGHKFPSRSCDTANYYCKSHLSLSVRYLSIFKNLIVRPRGKTNAFIATKIFFLNERISSSNFEFLYKNQNYFNYLLNDKKKKKMYLHKNNCSSLFFLCSFLSFLLTITVKRGANERFVCYTIEDSQVLESIIYVDRNDTCFLDLDTGRDRGGYGGDESDRGQYRISLAGVLWKFVRAILSIQ